MQPIAAYEEDWRRHVEEQTARLSSEFVRIRRHLHHNPEVSNAEFETTQYLIAETRKLGFDPHPAPDGRGMWCDVGTPSDSEMLVGIRGDMDALPISTRSAADYRSSVPGVMHACGHDVHATVALGANTVLQSLRESGLLPWPIASRALLQPAEETSDGALHMIAAGATQGLGAILALHVDPTLSVGTIGLRDGVLTAGCDVFYIDIHGRAGHGARPHEAADPIAAGAYWIDQAYRQVSRCVDVRTAPALSVGQFAGGGAPNAISETALLSGTLRTTEPESREAALEMLHRVAQTAESLHGVRFEMRFDAYTPAVVNDSKLINSIRRTAVGLESVEHVVEISLPSMGAEDFAFYLDALPGAMFRLGTCGGADSAHALHTSRFDIDERAIAIGISTLAATVIDLSRPEV